MERNSGPILNYGTGAQPALQAQLAVVLLFACALIYGSIGICIAVLVAIHGAATETDAAIILLGVVFLLIVALLFVFSALGLRRSSPGWTSAGLVLSILQTLFLAGCFLLLTMEPFMSFDATPLQVLRRSMPWLILAFVGLLISCVLAVSLMRARKMNLGIAQH